MRLFTGKTYSLKTVRPKSTVLASFSSFNHFTVMRIALQTFGTAGDIRPFIALGAALVQQGHSVTLTVTSIDNRNYENLSNQCGLAYRQVPGAVRIPPSGVRHIGLSSNPLRSMFMTLQATMFPFIESIYNASLALCLDNDAIVSHFGLFTARAAAKKTGIPHAGITFWPGFVVPQPEPVQSLLWTSVHSAVEHIFRECVNDIWSRAGLAPPKNLLAEAFFSDTLNIIAASRLLADPDPAWPANYRLGGYLSLPPSAETADVPHDLRQFLDAGDPPVLVTFGSLHSIYRDECDRLLMQAAHLSSRRIIIQSAMPVASRNKRIFCCGPLPHSLFLDRCAAAVIHGGAGSAHVVVGAGIPSVTVAFNEEQYAWGRALHIKGLGAEPLRFRNTTAEHIVHSIETVIENEKIILCARRTGLLLQRENGALHTAGIIEDVLLKKKSVPD